MKCWKPESYLLTICSVLIYMCEANSINILSHTLCLSLTFGRQDGIVLNHLLFSVRRVLWATAHQAQARTCGRLAADPKCELTAGMFKPTETYLLFGLTPFTSCSQSCFLIRLIRKFGHFRQRCSAAGPPEAPHIHFMSLCGRTGTYRQSSNEWWVEITSNQSGNSIFTDPAVKSPWRALQSCHQARCATASLSC